MLWQIDKTILSLKERLIGITLSGICLSIYPVVKLLGSYTLLVLVSMTNWNDLLVWAFLDQFQ